MSKSKKAQDKAVVDRSDVSWKETKRIAKLFNRLEKLNIDDPDEYDDEYDRIWSEIQVFMSSVIVSIPSSWLISSAPPDLDWSDPESLDWVRSEKFSELAEVGSVDTEGN